MKNARKCNKLDICSYFSSWIQTNKLSNQNKLAAKTKLTKKALAAFSAASFWIELAIAVAIADSKSLVLISRDCRK